MSCYCNEVTFRPCPFCRLNKTSTWESLTTEERAKAVTYKRLLLTGKKPPNIMVEFINYLHEKYEDFDVRDIP